MELIQITNEMYAVSQRLSNATNEIYKLANKRAMTERTYRMELAKEITKLRADGMPATLISDLARGNVAELKYHRDLAEGQYRSSIEALEALKSQLSALQTVSKYHTEIGA
jgi:capsule polysaccharide export protein KpsE/RkpR